MKTALRRSAIAGTRSLTIRGMVFCRRIAYMRNAPVGDFIGSKGEDYVVDS